MRARRAIVFCSLVFAATLFGGLGILSGSSASASGNKSGDTVIVVVRHAEKAAPEANTGDSSDPPLSPVGQQRAIALARALSAADIGAVYATAFQRTQQTAAPTAKASGVAISTYDAGLAAPELVERLLREHRGQTILVVGHSNTVPAIVSALSGKSVDPIGDSEYDRLYLVAIDAQGQRRLFSTGYPKFAMP